MGNRATPPRSFNTIKHSQRDARVKRRRQQRLVLLSMFATVALILVCTLVLLVGSIVGALANLSQNPGNEDDSGKEGDTPSPSGIEYQAITKPSSDIQFGELILVNETHEYRFPSGLSLINVYDNRTKINGSNIYQVTYNTYQLERSAFSAFDAMIVKYYNVSEDSSILITSAYRTREDQESLGSSVQPGYSDHHTGYCIAVMSASTTGRDYLEDSHWIYQNCYKYGFVLRYPADKTAETGISDYEHCLRYVGISHATYMTNNNLCLEEYVELLKTSYSSDNHLSITGADNNQYEVYYVPASSEDVTTINVPSNFAYTISGDNDSGFIITVNLSSPIA
ncbi:MAG: M15 family metallopeptidase [Clostridia bacterium]|nr:M15 family metallopeptidase [Clostridia bacterium]